MPTNNIKLLNAVKNSVLDLWYLTLTSIIIPIILGIILIFICHYTNTDITFDSLITSFEVKIRKSKQ